MKQQLTEEDRRALVAYRLERAHETMKEIPYHIENGYYATAAIACIMLVTMRLLLYL